MPIQAKICGLTTPEAVAAVVRGGAEYAGFVFYPKSPRHLTLEKAAALVGHLPKHIRKVAVVVDAPDDALLAIRTAIAPDFFQLHGKETPARVSEVKTLAGDKVIKAVTVRTADDIASARAYQKIADMLLFDAKAPKGLPGGNGISFDWELLKDKHFDIPWMLSGGLNAENIAEAVRVSGAGIVDVSSSVESSPGIKDPKLVSDFLRAVKGIKR